METINGKSPVPSERKSISSTKEAEDAPVPRRPSNVSVLLWERILSWYGDARKTGKCELVPQDIQMLLEFVSGMDEVERPQNQVLVDFLHSRLTNRPDLFDESFSSFVESEYTKSRSRRRNSIFANISSTRKVSLNNSSPNSLLQDSDPLRALATFDDWTFNVFTLASSVQHPAALVTETALDRLGLIDAYSINRDTLTAFLSSIDSSYIRTNSYHNAVHAADVTQSLYHFIRSCGLSECLPSDVCLAGIIGACIHDVGHVGVNNKYLVRSSNELAILYNDRSPLENMHLALAFQTMTTFNFFSTFNDKSRVEIRRLIIESVLSTDNDQHFDLIRRAEVSIASQSQINPDLLLSLSLHAADVSNPAKSWALYSEWTDRIMTEFFLQGDREADGGLQISPAFDRANPVPRAKFQAGFIVAIVQPLFTLLGKVPNLRFEGVSKQLEDNLDEWKRRQDACDMTEPMAGVKGIPHDLSSPSLRNDEPSPTAGGERLSTDPVMRMPRRPSGVVTKLFPVIK